MKICPHCYSSCEDNARFCQNCGAPLDEAKTEKTEAKTNEPINDGVFVNPDATFTPKDEPASGNLNVGQLIWSIVNLILCCMPLGVVSLIFTILANSADTGATERARLRTAKILNIIATVLGAVIVVLYIVFFVAIGNIFTEELQPSEIVLFLFR